MSQQHTSRFSDNPYIDRVWTTRNLTDGVYVATPDGSWDLILGVAADGTKSMMLAGQATKPMHVPYQKDTWSVVISFAPDTYLLHVTDNRLVDSFEMLPIIDNTHFMLAGHTLPLPTYEQAEDLVEAMTRLGIVRQNEVVKSVVDGAPKAASKRAVQRHFTQTTGGMTHKQLQQIKRAQEAVRLLQKGKKPVDVAAEVGFTDQPHLAKSLKKIMGAKPSDVDDIHKL